MILELRGMEKRRGGGGGLERSSFRLFFSNETKVRKYDKTIS